MTAPIKFGTDGWRGIIADDFTFDNVRRVAGAIAAYVLKHEEARRGLIVGYDTRFTSPQRCPGCRRSLGWSRNSGQAGQRLHAHTRNFICREATRGRWRRGHHLES